VMSLETCRSTQDKPVSADNKRGRASNKPESTGDKPGSAGDMPGSDSGKPGRASNHCRAVSEKPLLLRKCCWCAWKS